MPLVGLAAARLTAAAFAYHARNRARENVLRRRRDDRVVLDHKEVAREALVQMAVAIHHHDLVDVGRHLVLHHLASPVVHSRYQSPSLVVENSITRASKDEPDPIERLERRILSMELAYLDADRRLGNVGELLEEGVRIDGAIGVRRLAECHVDAYLVRVSQRIGLGDVMSQRVLQGREQQRLHVLVLVRSCVLR